MYYFNIALKKKIRFMQTYFRLPRAFPRITPPCSRNVLWLRINSFRALFLCKIQLHNKDSVMYGNCIYIPAVASGMALYAFNFKLNATKWHYCQLDVSASIFRKTVRAYFFKRTGRQWNRVN